MIKYEQARGLLARAVLTQSPGFVYNAVPGAPCKYYPFTPEETGDPASPKCATGCIVGVALVLAGETRHLNRNAQYGSVWDLYTRKELAGLMSHKAEKYLEKAQLMQDNGYSWGDAYRAAEAVDISAYSDER